MRRNNRVVLTLVPTGEKQWEELAPDPGGRHRGRGEGDLRGVLTLRHDFNGLYSGGVP